MRNLKKDRDNCKTFFEEDIGYTKCMKSKGLIKRFFIENEKQNFTFYKKSTK